MTDIFISSDNILSPLGLTTAENFRQLTQNVSGIKLHDDQSMSEQPFQAALFDDESFFTNNSQDNYTKFEKLLIASISDALASTGISATDKKTVLIISSTKGNISLLEREEPSASLNKRISQENQNGWEVVQVIPDTSSNLLNFIVRVFLLMVTLLIYTTSDGYYVILRRKEIAKSEL